jgi:hypothetical protein
MRARPPAAAEPGRAAGDESLYIDLVGVEEEAEEGLDVVRLDAAIDVREDYEALLHLAAAGRAQE